MLTNNTSSGIPEWRIFINTKKLKEFICVRQTHLWPNSCQDTANTDVLQ